MVQPSHKSFPPFQDDASCEFGFEVGHLFVMFTVPFNIYIFLVENLNFFLNNTKWNGGEQYTALASPT